MARNRAGSALKNVSTGKKVGEDSATEKEMYTGRKDIDGKEGARETTGPTREAKPREKE